jgi:hypothetical protein
MSVLTVIGIALAGWLLMTCVRSIAWLPRIATEMLLNAINSTEPRGMYLRRTFIGHKTLNRQA